MSETIQDNGEPNKDDPVLCYVKGCWAYFTTLAIADQWGDDWNDAPYEYNAENPYGPHGNDEHWSIVKVAFDGDFLPPCDGHFNSPYSVQDINGGACPWLQTSKYAKERVYIPAGVALSQFRALIARGGGKVYTESHP